MHLSNCISTLYLLYTVVQADSKYRRPSKVFTNWIHGFFFDIMDSRSVFFVGLAQELFGRQLGRSSRTTDARFRSLFGTSAEVAAQAWGLVRASLPGTTHPRHLVWALLFLKCYPLEVVMSAMTGADESTVRYWVWLVVEALAKMKTVNFSL